jgi:hypothetical protein
MAGKNMKTKKLTFAENLAHPPLRPEMKRAKNTDPLFELVLPAERAVTSGPTVYEMMRLSAEKVLAKAVIKYKLTDLEAKQVISLANALAVKKHSEVDGERMGNAVQLVVSERPPLPQVDKSEEIPLVQELEWSTFAKEMLVRATAKHDLTDVEVKRVIILANGCVSASVSSVMNNGWVANAIGTVLRRRDIMPT